MTLGNEFRKFVKALQMRCKSTEGMWKVLSSYRQRRRNELQSISYTRGPLANTYALI